jgi:hypothetical protein
MEVRAFGRAGVGPVVEVGCLPLAGLAAGCAAVALIARRERYVKGTCRGCGYSLDGLSGGACPECGRAERGGFLTRVAPVLAKGLLVEPRTADDQPLS